MVQKIKKSNCTEKGWQDAIAREEKIARAKLDDTENLILAKDPNAKAYLRYICRNGPNDSEPEDTLGGIFKTKEDCLFMFRNDYTTVIFPDAPMDYLTVDGRNYKLVLTKLRSAFNESRSEWQKYTREIEDLEAGMK